MLNLGGFVILSDGQEDPRVVLMRRWLTVGLTGLLSLLHVRILLLLCEEGIKSQRSCSVADELLSKRVDKGGNDISSTWALQGGKPIVPASNYTAWPHSFIRSRSRRGDINRVGQYKIMYACKSHLAFSTTCVFCAGGRFLVVGNISSR